MSISLDSSPRVADVLDAVRELAPEIRNRAAEVESARRVPLDLLDDLKGAGCFGLLLPTHARRQRAATWPARCECSRS